MCKMCKEMASIGAEDQDQDERLEAAGFRKTTVEEFLDIPKIPTRQLDLPRGFWERWGQLEVQPMSERQADLLTSLRLDLEAMLDS